MAAVAIKDELLREVAASATEFFERKLTPGGDAGDTSLRDPESGLIYILPRPAPDRPFQNWSEVGPDYVAVVDPTGASVLDNGVQPTVELATHLMIYEARPEVCAIVHSHGEWSQIFSILRWDIPTFTSDTYFIGGMGPIRCAPTGGVATDECAREALKALGERAQAALLPSHGAVCLGKDFRAAFHVAEMVERAARQALYIRLLGGAPQMSLEDLMGREGLAAMSEAAEAGGETVEAMLMRVAL
ncbi:MAG TPA: class II aldolase/adducin family protein [Acidimicrobiales bacterium]|nr:class II aldolase/adducin family protein [Acidimicrobiales bacterium]